MNSKHINELNFWKNLIDSRSWEDYLAIRKHDIVYHYDGFTDESGKCLCELTKGKGLEIGSGAYSMLEFVEGDSDIIAVDPLMDHYINIVKKPNKRVKLCSVVDENLPFKDNNFDWVVCWNVIDHTPDPFLMLEEIERVMKPGGYFYLHIQFDYTLSEACHYSLWDEQKVRDLVIPMFGSPCFTKIKPRPEHYQDMYYGIYKGIK